MKKMGLCLFISFLSDFQLIDAPDLRVKLKLETLFDPSLYDQSRSDSFETGQEIHFWAIRADQLLLWLRRVATRSWQRDFRRDRRDFTEAKEFTKSIRRVLKMRRAKVGISFWKLFESPLSWSKVTLGDSVSPIELTASIQQSNWTLNFFKKKFQWFNIIYRELLCRGTTMILK